MLHLAAAAVCLVGLAAPARAEPPLLKPTVTVAGELVHIGDLVANAGERAGIAIFRAPDPGHTGAVAAARVLDALRPHGLGEVETGGVVEVLVTRTSRSFPPKAIERRIAELLAGRHGLGAADQLAVVPDVALRTLHVEAQAADALQPLRIGYDPRTRRFDMLLHVPGSRMLQQQPLRVTGIVHETVEAVVLVRSLQRGEAIRSGDLAVERRPRGEAGTDVLTRPEQALGMAARRPLRAGQPVRDGDLMRPELVQRNETVTLIYEVPGIVLTMRGIAQEAGAEGDVISVMNQQSKRIVQGTVSGAGRVTVPPTLARLAAIAPSAPSNRPTE